MTEEEDGHHCERGAESGGGWRKRKNDWRIKRSVPVGAPPEVAPSASFECGHRALK